MKDNWRQLGIIRENFKIVLLMAKLQQMLVPFCASLFAKKKKKTHTHKDKNCTLFLNGQYEQRRIRDAYISQI